MTWLRHGKEIEFDFMSFYVILRIINTFKTPFNEYEEIKIFLQHYLQCCSVDYDAQYQRKHPARLFLLVW